MHTRASITSSSRDDILEFKINETSENNLATGNEVAIVLKNI